MNVPILVPVSYHSFGGWKNSTFVDHGMYRTDGVHFYTREKTITTRRPYPTESGIDLDLPRHDQGTYAMYFSTISNNSKRTTRVSSRPSLIT